MVILVLGLYYKNKLVCYDNMVDLGSKAIFAAIGRRKLQIDIVIDPVSDPKDIQSFPERISNDSLSFQTFLDPSVTDHLFPVSCCCHCSFSSFLL